MSLIDLSTRVEWLQFLLLLTNEPLPCEEALLRSPFDEPTFHASEGIKFNIPATVVVHRGRVIWSTKTTADGALVGKRESVPAKSILKQFGQHALSKDSDKWSSFCCTARWLHIAPHWAIAQADGVVAAGSASSSSHATEATGPDAQEMVNLLLGFDRVSTHGRKRTSDQSRVRAVFLKPSALVNQLQLRSIANALQEHDLSKEKRRKHALHNSHKAPLPSREVQHVLTQRHYRQHPSAYDKPGPRSSRSKQTTPHATPTTGRSLQSPTYGTNTGRAMHHAANNATVHTVHTVGRDGDVQNLEDLDYLLDDVVDGSVNDAHYQMSPAIARGDTQVDNLPSGHYLRVDTAGSPAASRQPGSAWDMSLATPAEVAEKKLVLPTGADPRVLLRQQRAAVQFERRIWKYKESISNGTAASPTQPPLFRFIGRGRQHPLPHVLQSLVVPADCKVYTAQLGMNNLPAPSADGIRPENIRGGHFEPVDEDSESDYDDDDEPSDKEQDQEGMQGQNLSDHRGTAMKRSQTMQPAVAHGAARTANSRPEQQTRRRKNHSKQAAQTPIMNDTPLLPQAWSNHHREPTVYITAQEADEKFLTPVQQRQRSLAKAAQKERAAAQREAALRRHTREARADAKADARARAQQGVRSFHPVTDINVEGVYEPGVRTTLSGRRLGTSSPRHSSSHRPARESGEGKQDDEAPDDPMQAIPEAVRTEIQGAIRNLAQTLYLRMRAYITGGSMQFVIDHWGKAWLVEVPGISVRFVHRAVPYDLQLLERTPESDRRSVHGSASPAARLQDRLQQLVSPKPRMRRQRSLQQQPSSSPGPSSLDGRIDSTRGLLKTASAPAHRFRVNLASYTGDAPKATAEDGIIAQSGPKSPIAGPIRYKRDAQLGVLVADTSRQEATRQLDWRQQLKLQRGEVRPTTVSQPGPSTTFNAMPHDTNPLGGPESPSPSRCSPSGAIGEARGVPRGSEDLFARSTQAMRAALGTASGSVASGVEGRTATDHVSSQLLVPLLSSQQQSGLVPHFARPHSATPRYASKQSPPASHKVAASTAAGPLLGVQTVSEAGTEQGRGWGTTRSAVRFIGHMQSVAKNVRDASTTRPSTARTHRSARRRGRDTLAGRPISAGMFRARVPLNTTES